MDPIIQAGAKRGARADEEEEERALLLKMEEEDTSCTPAPKKHRRGAGVPFLEVSPKVQRRIDSSRLGLLPWEVQLRLVGLFGPLSVLHVFCEAYGLAARDCLSGLSLSVLEMVLYRAAGAGWSYQYYGAGRDRVDVIKRLLDLSVQRGFNLWNLSNNTNNVGTYYNARNSADLALTCAVKNGEVELVRGLISQATAAGKSIAAGYGESSALLSAAAKSPQHVQLLDLLLAQGGSFTEPATLRDIIQGYSGVPVSIALLGAMARRKVPVYLPPADDGRHKALVLKAAESGATDVLRYIMGQGGIGPKVWKQQEVDHRGNKVQVGHSAVALAAKGKHMDTLRLLAELKVRVPADRIAEVAVEACTRGDSQIVEFLLSKPFSKMPKPEVKKVVCGAAGAGQLDLMNRLCQKFKLDISECPEVLVSAARGGQLEVVRVLLACNRVNVSKEGGTSLLEAAKGGHVEVARALLACEEVDVNEEGGKVLLEAAMSASLQLVEAVLACPRFKMDAYKHGWPSKIDLGMAQLLINKGIGSPTGHHVSDAMKRRKWDLAGFLVQSKRCNLSDGANGLLLEAVGAGRVTLALQLLQQPSYPPVDKVEGTTCLLHTVRKGHAELQRALVKHVFLEEVESIAEELGQQRGGTKSGDDE